MLIYFGNIPVGYKLIILQDRDSYIYLVGVFKFPSFITHISGVKLHARGIYALLVKDMRAYRFNEY